MTSTTESQTTAGAKAVAHTEALAHAQTDAHADHGRHPAAPPAHAASHQQHPLKLYFVVWIMLFVLSACSYAVDYFDFHGYVRWSLIIFFMMAKAGLIVAVFMHMAWERLALVYAILLPPLAVLVFMAAMAFEGSYTNASRFMNFVTGS